MCTTISEQIPARGSAKGPDGWFSISRASVGYDHPAHASAEHAVLLDCGDPSAGPGHRVAIELDRTSARALATLILATLDEADAYEGDAAA